MDKAKIYEDFKRLMSYPEWKTFDTHIKEIAKNHREISNNFLSKDNIKDAQRQTWLSEGLMEAINEPKHFIDFENSLTSRMMNKICHVCGHALSYIKANLRD